MRGLVKEGGRKPERIESGMTLLYIGVSQQKSIMMIACDGEKKKSRVKIERVRKSVKQGGDGSRDSVTMGKWCLHHSSRTTPLLTLSNTI